MFLCDESDKWLVGSQEDGDGGVEDETDAGEDENNEVEEEEMAGVFTPQKKKKM